MLKIKEITKPGYEKVIEAIDSTIDLHAFIAIHSTSLGPALGGLRIYPYATPQLALEDALGLAEAMTKKSAFAEVGLGGGKSVILADPATPKREILLQSFAEVLNRLEGKYIAAEDIGTSTQDMLLIHRYSPFVAALPTDTSSGDPSRFTAWGVCQGIKAVARQLWGEPTLKDVVIAVQGLGNVGEKLARHLFWEGARLILCDLDHEKALLIARRYGAQVIKPEYFTKTECDILAPCAMGGLFSKRSVKHLCCSGIAGAANNQLTNLEMGRVLMDRGILYAPDFIINAGGIINAAAEFDPLGYDPLKSRERVIGIYDKLTKLFKRAKREKIAPSELAEKLAERNLAKGIGRRQDPIRF